MYLLKQYIKNKYKKFFHKNLSLYLKECKILDEALNISKNKKELKKNSEKLGNICDDIINEYIYDKIYNKNVSLIKLKKNIKTKNNKKIK